MWTQFWFIFFEGIVSIELIDCMDYYSVCSSFIDSKSNSIILSHRSRLWFFRWSILSSLLKRIYLIRSKVLIVDHCAIGFKCTLIRSKERHQRSWFNDEKKKCVFVSTTFQCKLSTTKLHFSQLQISNISNEMTIDVFMNQVKIHFYSWILLSKIENI